MLGARSTHAAGWNKGAWRRRLRATDGDRSAGEDVEIAGRVVCPNCVDVALEVQSDLWCERRARIVREVVGSREGGAAIGGTAKENIRIAGAAIRPNHVNVAARVQGDLWCRAENVGETLRGGE